MSVEVRCRNVEEQLAQASGATVGFARSGGRRVTQSYVATSRQGPPSSCSISDAPRNVAENGSAARVIASKSSSLQRPFRG